MCIESEGPWENGCRESFYGKPRDGLRNEEIFRSLKEAHSLFGKAFLRGMSPSWLHSLR